MLFSLAFLWTHLDLPAQLPTYDHSDGMWLSFSMPREYMRRHLSSNLNVILQRVLFEWLVIFICASLPLISLLPASFWSKCCCHFFFVLPVWQKSNRAGAGLQLGLNGRKPTHWCFLPSLPFTRQVYLTFQMNHNYFHCSKFLMKILVWC